jgi:hypothetical protein
MLQLCRALRRVRARGEGAHIGVKPLLEFIRVDADLGPDTKGGEEPACESRAARALRAETSRLVVRPHTPNPLSTGSPNL